MTDKTLYEAKQDFMNYISQFLQDLETSDYDTNVDLILDHLQHICEAHAYENFEKNIKPYLIEQFRKMLDD